MIRPLAKKQKTIKEIAANREYVPNRIAKGLSNGRTYTIAAIVGGYLIFHSGNRENINFMKEQDIPFVLYTKYFSDMECDYVVCDDVCGGAKLIEYFLEMGHRRIAYVYDRSLQESSEVLNRQEGYRKALERAGIRYDEELVLPYFYTMEEDDLSKQNEQLLKQLKSQNPPTALFVCNDIVASNVLVTLKSWGYKIPKDISVAGYEGIYLGTVLDPPLTTISSPINEMGKKACQSPFLCKALFSLIRIGVRLFLIIWRMCK